MEGRYIGRKFKTVFLSREIQIPADNGKELIKCGKILSEMGLGEYEGGNYSGNISFRWKEGFVITAGGTNLGDIKEDDLIVVIDCDLKNKIAKVNGRKEPSSETMLHWSIYRKRPEVNAIFHGHDWDVLKKAKELNLPVTEKEQPYGSKELALEVVKILDNHNYIVLKNGGIVSLGKSMEEALEHVKEMHELSERV